MTDKNRLSARRDFLKSVAVGAAAAYGAPCFIPRSAFGSGAPSNRINVGCIGIGNMGFTDLQGLMHQDDTQIVAVCDVNRGSYGYKTASQFRGRESARKLVNDYYAQKRNSGVYVGTDAYVDFRARYANGVELICTPGGVEGAVRFEGTEGWVHVDWNSFRTHPESLMDTVIGPDEIHLYQSRDHMRNFLDCIRSGQDPIAPVEVGHRSASVCHLANIAMKLKRKLRWDPDEERFVNDEQANRLLSKSVRAPWHL